MILAVDPGPKESAFVLYDDRLNEPVEFAKLENQGVLETIVQHDAQLVVEMIASYGMAVGREVFDTCTWIGRYEQCAIEAWWREPVRVFRGTVKLHLCNSVRAKDANVRQALIDRFGGKESTKRGGLLHGVTGDVWAALAVAVTYADAQKLARAA